MPKTGSINSGTGHCKLLEEVFLAFVISSITHSKINLCGLFYNLNCTETYCKRLRVICPEHTKEPKILDTEVCGFPLTKTVFNATGEFCRSEAFFITQN